MNILIVEPDSSLRQNLSLLLREMGHETLTLEHWEETVPFLNGYWPDAIIMNYFLGSCTAADLCEEIKTLFGEMPATLIHSPDHEHRFFALRYPETSFLRSPFSPDEIQNRFDLIRIDNWGAAS